MNDDINITETNGNYRDSVFSITDSNGKAREKPQPVIWEAESASEPVKTKNPDKPEKSEPITCEKIKHNTDLYNPEKLNKGQYLEVAFKNDLIFDLDM